MQIYPMKPKLKAPAIKHLRPNVIICLQSCLNFLHSNPTCAATTRTSTMRDTCYVGLADIALHVIGLPSYSNDKGSTCVG